MSANALVFVTGFLAGVLAAFVAVLRVLVRFIESDVDGFRRWLDKAGA